MPGTASVNGGIAELILSAGPVAKFILLLLAVFSIVCWALIVEKWWEFRKIRRDTTSFVRIFRARVSPLGSSTSSASTGIPKSRNRRSFMKTRARSAGSGIGQRVSAGASARS